MKIKLFYYLVLILIFCGCRFTTTTSQAPIFNRGTELLARQIDSLVQSEHIDVKGTSTKTNGAASSELTVKIINGKSVPSETNEQNNLGLLIAKKFRSALKNHDQFDEIKILFVVQEINGNTTKTKYSGRSFPIQELTLD